MKGNRQERWGENPTLISEVFFISLRSTQELGLALCASSSTGPTVITKNMFQSSTSKKTPKCIQDHENNWRTPCKVAPYTSPKHTQHEDLSLRNCSSSPSTLNGNITTMKWNPFNLQCLSALKLIHSPYLHRCIFLSLFFIEAVRPL